MSQFEDKSINKYIKFEYYYFTQDEVLCALK